MTVASALSGPVWKCLARRVRLRLLLTLGVMALLVALRGRQEENPTFDAYSIITDKEYYAMPHRYELDEYYGCLVRGGVYCFGMFQLEAPPGNELFHMIQMYSKDWIWRSNHSLIQRGVCLSRRCPREEPQNIEDNEWFASCVNSTMLSEYKMSARLTYLEYCTRESQGGRLTAAGAAFLALLAVLVVAVVISTVLHVRISHERKKDMGWALSWSVVRSLWTLTKPSPRTEPDLRFLDGLRAISMLFLIGLHAGGLSVLQIADTRFYEQSSLWLLSGNVTLMVQVFFIVSSFLMARKVLQQDFMAAKKTFVETIKDRIARILPSYAFMILYIVTLNEYNSSGPMWHSVIETEVATCRQQWWMNLLFLNNFNTSIKCMGQTWYLAADMQLYAAGLLLTLLLRGRRAVPVLAVLLASAAVFYVYLAYAWNLVPLYALHVPDNFRDEYEGVSTFNVLYQTPWGNAFAALTGMLLAHAHRAIKTSNYDLRSYKVYRFVARWSIPSLLVWVVLWPCVHPQPPHKPTRLRYALITGLTGPVFCLLVAVIMMEILLGGKKCLRRFLTSNVYSVMARLSLPVLLVHFPIARVQLMTQDWPVHLNIFRLLYFQSSSYFMRNGNLALQAFAMIAGLLHTNSQIISKKNTRLSHLPLAVLKRIARYFFSYYNLVLLLVVVGFAATWWRYTGDGPLWPNLVLLESDVCRRKFLWHALFLHNLVDNDDHCLVPTWSIAVDLQLFVAAYLLMSLLTITGRKPIPVLSMLFIVFSVLNGLLAYWNEWESMIFIALPENLRLFFRGSRSFSNFYLSPLTNVPAYLVGIIWAHVNKHVQVLLNHHIE